MLLLQLRWFALNKPQALHLKRNQHGFALVVVLITLLILAGVVASMLRGQTLKLAQTGNYFNLNEQRQASHNAHRACLGIVKSALQSWTVGAINWAAPIALPDGVSTCTIIAPAAALPAPLLNGQPVSWPQPRLIVSTMSNGVPETSEVLYPACNLLNVACVQSAAVITLSNGVLVSPVILVGGAVQVGWRGSL